MQFWGIDLLIDLLFPGPTVQFWVIDWLIDLCFYEKWRQNQNFVLRWRKRRKCWDSLKLVEIKPDRLSDPGLKSGPDNRCRGYQFCPLVCKKKQVGNGVSFSLEEKEIKRHLTGPFCSTRWMDSACGPKREEAACVEPLCPAGHNLHLAPLRVWFSKTPCQQRDFVKDGCKAILTRAVIRHRGPCQHTPLRLPHRELSFPARLPPATFHSNQLLRVLVDFIKLPVP
jgi:hypothetical protein